MCAVSGVPLTYLKAPGRKKKWTNASIDRIDSDISYNPNNIHVVCKAINIMKNDMSLEELRFWCAHVVLANAEDDEEPD